MSESDLANEIDTRPTHKPNGQLAPGNRWMMPRWQPGQSGKPMMYTPVKLWYAVREHVAKFDERQKERIANGLSEQRLTWSGLAHSLNISRQALDKYANGEIGQAEDDRAGVVAVLEQYRVLLESDLEDRLTDKAYATQGVIFALKNQAGWRDEKHLNVQTEEKQRLIVQLDPELRAKLEHQAGEVFEGEFSVDTKGR